MLAPQCVSAFNSGLAHNPKTLSREEHDRLALCFKEIALADG